MPVAPSLTRAWLCIKLNFFSSFYSEELNQWIQQVIENKLSKDFPTRLDYDKRLKMAEIQEKYSGQVTVQEILDIYEDPESYFMDKKRSVSELYKKHSINHLKKKFQHIKSEYIDKIFKKHNGLFLPCVRALEKCPQTQLKNRHQANHVYSIPSEINENFLKELQYHQMENEVKDFIKQQKKDYKKKVTAARKSGFLMECGCCYNDECLMDEMMPCEGGHLFCKDCIKRASEV